MFRDKTTIIFFVFLAVVCVHICVNFFTVSTNEMNQINDDTVNSDAYHLYYNTQHQNVAITDYDIADQYVFFSYSEGRSVVEAFDLNGNYLFSISFADRQKGTILVQGEGKQIFIRTKNDGVFIFDGDQLVEILDEQTAKHRGYDYEWFSTKQNRLKFTGMRLHVLDEAGNKKQHIPVPGYIIANFYKKYSVFFAMTIVICVVLFRRVAAVRRGKKTRRQGDIFRKN